MTSILTALCRNANYMFKVPQGISSFTRTFSFIRPVIAHPNELTATVTNFLRPQLPILSQLCGFKVKFKLKRRCKDCYFVVRDRRKYVICPTHPRHKQMSMIKKEKYTRIITHACQSKVRPW